MSSGTATVACPSPAGALRARTRSAHERVERRADAPARMADRASYRTWLELLLGFHARADAALEQRFGADDLPASERTGRLRRDLLALGADPADADALPCLDPAWIPGGASACGVLYVVEGSALGGAVLGRQARAALGVTPSCGAAFFSGAGSPAPRWRSVCALLDARLQDERDVAAAVDGALEAFVAFEEWTCR